MRLERLAGLFTIILLPRFARKGQRAPSAMRPGTKLVALRRRPHRLFVRVQLRVCNLYCNWRAKPGLYDVCEILFTSAEFLPCEAQVGQELLVVLHVHPQPAGLEVRNV